MIRNFSKDAILFGINLIRKENRFKDVNIDRRFQLNILIQILPTSWWLNVSLLLPLMITGKSKSCTRSRQSEVGVATSITYERYLQKNEISY